MQVELWTHPACYNVAIDRLDVAVERPSATLLRLRYVVLGRIDGLVLPAPAPPVRANNLWRTTCFEAFLKPAGLDNYCELNFSPSSQWAAYDFSAYRDGMRNAPLPAAPDIELTIAAGRLELAVALSLDLPHDSYRLGLAAVIEQQGGAISHWALRHPRGGPDFHHDTCFALELPPVGE